MQDLEEVDSGDFSGYEKEVKTEDVIKFEGYLHFINDQDKFVKRFYKLISKDLYCNLIIKIDRLQGKGRCKSKRRT